MIDGWLSHVDHDRLTLDERRVFTMRIIEIITSHDADHRKRVGYVRYFSSMVIMPCLMD